MITVRMQEYSWDRNNGEGEQKNIRSKICLRKVTLPLMDLPGKPQRQFLQLQKIYFLGKTWRILSLRESTHFHSMLMGISRLPKT